MKIILFLNRETGEIVKNIFLKRNNRKIQYIYELCSPHSGGDVVDIYSIKSQTLRTNFAMKRNRFTAIKKKTYRCYHKEFVVAQEGDWK